MKQMKNIQYTEKLYLHDRYKNVVIWKGSLEDLRKHILQENKNVRDYDQISLFGIRISNLYVTESDSYAVDTDENCLIIRNPKRYGLYKEDIYGKVATLSIYDVFNEMIHYNIAKYNHEQTPRTRKILTYSRHLGNFFSMYYKVNNDYAYNHDYFRKEPISGTGRGRWFNSGYYRRPKQSGIRKLNSLYTEKYGDFKDYSQYYPISKKDKLEIFWYDERPRSNLNRSWKNKKIRHQWQKNLK